jgi:hypothetical protein
MTAFTSPV